jgi:single-strand DNA-binding protein
MNINRVILTGNLTRDPEHSTTPSGTSVCKLGIAVNGRRKTKEGNWEEKANFFRVTVFGKQADNCYQYLKKGRAIAIDGRLEWSQWEREGQKRESVDIIAENVQFLGGGRDDAAGANGNGSSSAVSTAKVEGDVPIDTADFEPAPVATSTGDEDIPF